MHKPFLLAALILLALTIHSTNASEATSPWSAAALQLGAERYADRQAAERQLEAAGAEASLALAGAVLHGNQQARRAAFELLSRQLRSPSPSLKIASLDALKLIAKAQHPVYSRRAAKLAESVASSENRRSLSVATENQRGLEFMRGVREIQFRTRGDAKELVVEETNRRVTISKRADGRVAISFTSDDRTNALNNRGVTFRDLAEIQARHPTFYNVYRRYAPLLSRRPPLARAPGAEVSAD